MVQVRVACVSVGQPQLILFGGKFCYISLTLRKQMIISRKVEARQRSSTPDWIAPTNTIIGKTSSKQTRSAFILNIFGLTTITGSSLLFFPLKWPLLRRCSPTFSLFSFTFEQCITRTKCFNSRALKGLFVVYFEGRPSRLV